ncbi:hypothetical protein CB0940_02340 [Cercospora beticola]|uniref:SnoaL-like domain-containing protein n=1 Tax=Cercospora beticola TaxID=122368 RepID=A0A2G5I1S3_CERBT|nr:hypothetical protein CB0940_02340 [Cercospora beticola]PIA98744.1 hypothetical protein CB0940_02340 [Cercospora beticola]WPA99470.1 hypothetical protein RHO25_004087 [Cercospora beticola]CAK1362403.1 unnamed protein product [Cercospora beticola]
MPADAHVQAATLQKFLAAWKSWNAESWLAVFDDSFEHITMPLNLGLPPKTKAEVAATLPTMMSAIRDCEFNVHETVHDPDRNKAAVYCTSKGVTDVGSWNMEYAAFITFNETGDKVAKFEEMIDSAFMKEFAPKFQKHMREQAA